MPKLSIVVPVYYNEQNLAITYRALRREINKNKMETDIELIFVDDGSEDNSYSVLKELQSKDPIVKIIKLSRNYGSQMAILAGIKNSSGDCMGCISADLQEPPELIFRMYKEWEKGYEIVIAAREGRQDNWMSRLMSNLFYFIFRMVVSKEMPKYGYDLFLIDKKVMKALSGQRLNNVGLIGQILQMGYKRQFVFYVRRVREIGRSRFTFGKKIKLAVDNIVNFSYIPLRFISIVGIFSSIFGFLFGFYSIFIRFFYKVPVKGYSTTVALISFFSGLVLFSLGIMGEYIWRILDVVKNNAEFLVEEKIGFDD